MQILASNPDPTVLRALRRSRGLTLDQVASAAGIERSYLSRVERRLEKPSGRVLRKLGEALDYPADQLLHDPAEVLR